jgi:uncharacterized protein YjbI with pentapeptide repeats
MKIVSRLDSEKVLYESEDKTVRETAIKAVASDANLRDANLSDADLSDADLSDANLRDADFNQVKFYGRGGNTKIKRTQIDEFLAALGIVVED